MSSGGDYERGDSAEAGTAAVPVGARLDYVDGIRALAAIYVMLGHAYYEPQNGYYASALLSHLGFQFTRLSVAVFIVVSGFCLMLPVARRQDQMGSLAT